jgi:amanitin/phalloidin family toxin
VTRTDIKGLNISILSSLEYKTMSASDINAARLPYTNGLQVIPPYVADDVNHTLTRGER